MLSTIRLPYFVVLGYQHLLIICKVNNFPLYAVLITPFFCVERGFITFLESE